MDETTGDAITRGNEYQVGPITRDIDATTLELAEELCRRFKLGAGRAILELTFVDGRFECGWLKSRLQKGQLAEA